MMDGNRQNIAKGDVRFGVWIMLCSPVFYLCIRPSDVLNLSTCCTWKTASSILTCRKNQHRWTKSNIWKELSEWLGVLLIAQNRNRVRFTFWFRWLGLVTWNTKLYNVDANMSEVIQERLCENWQRTDFCGLLATRYVWQAQKISCVRPIKIYIKRDRAVTSNHTKQLAHFTLKGSLPLRVSPASWTWLLDKVLPLQLVIGGGELGCGFRKRHRSQNRANRR